MTSEMTSEMKKWVAVAAGGVVLALVSVGVFYRFFRTAGEKGLDARQAFGRRRGEVTLH